MDGTEIEPLSDQDEDLVRFAMARRAVERFTIPRIARFITLMQRNAESQKDLQMLENLKDEHPEDLASFLLGYTDESRRLREIAPYGIFLDKQEMEEIKSVSIRKLVERKSPTYIPEEYLETDRAALEMGRRAAERLTPENIRQFHSFLTRMSNEQPSPYVDAWLQAVEAGPEMLKRLLADTTNRGQVMRSVVSFRAFVQKDERDSIMRETFTNGGRNGMSR